MEYTSDLQRVSKRRVALREGRWLRTDLEVLKLLAAGKNLKEIALELNISLSTVQIRLRRMRIEREVYSNPQLVYLAAKKGVI